MALVLVPRYSDLFTAWFDGYWLVHQFAVILIPVGVVLGLLYGALLSPCLAPRRVFLRAMLFSILTVGVVSIASLIVALFFDLPVRFWPQAFAFHHVSVAFVFPYAAALHALGSLIVGRWRRRALVRNAA